MKKARFSVTFVFKKSDATGVSSRKTGVQPLSILLAFMLTWKLPAKLFFKYFYIHLADTGSEIEQFLKTSEFVFTRIDKQRHCFTGKKVKDKLQLTVSPRILETYKF